MSEASFEERIKASETRPTEYENQIWEFSLQNLPPSFAILEDVSLEDLRKMSDDELHEREKRYKVDMADMSQEEYINLMTKLHEKTEKWMKTFGKIQKQRKGFRQIMDETVNVKTLVKFYLFQIGLVFGAWLIYLFFNYFLFF